METVEHIVEQHTAGSPVEPNVLWTNRSPRDIAGELWEYGYSLCAETVRRILKEGLGLGLRQACKLETCCHYAERDEQFQHIAELREKYRDLDWPVISIDTKKKEYIGDFSRPGQAWTDGRILAPDHDFPSRALGKLTPYGVYDVHQNQGFMLLTTGADTGELACDAVRRWWMRMGRNQYRSRRLLMLCDCGGGNGYRQYLFKQEVKHLAMRLGMNIRVAHYPPGCSKYNPIEHRMFCHVSRALKGLILDSVSTAARYIRQTTTQQGLSVIVEQARKCYQKAVKASDSFLTKMPILFDDQRPELNYHATPMAY